MTFPFGAVFIAYVMLYLTKVPLAVAMQRAGGYDNRNPREQQARLEGWGKRAAAAHANAFESFPAFAAGVVISHLGGANPTYANAFCIAYLVARAAYPALYIANIDKARSAVWGIGAAASGLLMLSPLL